MSNYDNTNKGVLWKNSYKEKGDKQPDVRGKINVEGKEYEISGWHNPAKENKTAYYSLKLSEPYVKPEASNNTSNVDDDLPF